MPANEKKLRNTLIANAGFSLLSGLGLILFREALASLMYIQQPAVLLYVGVGLLFFSASVWHAALRKIISQKQVQSIIIQDWAWVLASLVVVGVQAWNLSIAAYWMIAIVALLIADFAFFQMRFLKRL